MRTRFVFVICNKCNAGEHASAVIDIKLREKYTLVHTKAIDGRRQKMQETAFSIPSYKSHIAF